MVVVIGLGFAVAIGLAQGHRTDVQPADGTRTSSESRIVAVKSNESDVHLEHYTSNGESAGISPSSNRSTKVPMHKSYTISGASSAVELSVSATTSAICISKAACTL